MHVAIPLYPGFTALDAVGPYTVLAFAPGWTVSFVAAEPGPVVDDRGSLSLLATASYADTPRPGVILVPGGIGTADALSDKALLAWLRAAHPYAKWTTSVCSGSFLLGAAGLLKGRKATTHWGWADRLSAVGAEHVPERIVTDGSIVTAAGVSAGIDMALALLAMAEDDETARTVQLAIEYDPRPPFDAGNPYTAPESRREAALGLIG
jgi:transcriptional regulator GlxA family with amidase domain